MRYAAEGWGVGEVVLDGDVLVHHEAPALREGTVPCGDSPRGLSPLDPRGQSGLAARFRAYFAGARDDFLDVEIDADGATPFQLAVCEALRAVPYGEVVTYGELAALAGHPGAQRAVGTFCAGNRFAIVVPCHRVVAADGIGPYGSLGAEYKRRLLELERAAV